MALPHSFQPQMPHAGLHLQGLGTGGAHMFAGPAAVASLGGEFQHVDRADINPVMARTSLGAVTAADTGFVIDYCQAPAGILPHGKTDRACRAGIVAALSFAAHALIRQHHRMPGLHCLDSPCRADLGTPGAFRVLCPQTAMPLEVTDQGNLRVFLL